MKHLIFIFFFQLSCYAQVGYNNVDEDYIILKEIIAVSKKLDDNANTVSLSPKTSNRYTIDVVRALEPRSQGINDETIVVDIDDVLKHIFNDKEYKFLLSQESDGFWDYSKIGDKNILRHEKDVIIKGTVLAVGKPIYTSDHKFALVQINTEKWKAVQVFVKNKDKWEGYKLIAPLSMQRKATIKL